MVTGKAGEEQQADMEDETGLLPDSQVPPRETTSERPREEAYGTDEFGVQTIHGIPKQLWCTTQHQGAYTAFEVEEHPDWGTGKPESYWDYGDLELMSKQLAGSHLPYYDKKPSSGLGPRDIALGKTIMEERVITSSLPGESSDLRPSLLHGHVADCLLHSSPFQFFFLISYYFHQFQSMHLKILLKCLFFIT
jgi:hypothetical protein